MFDDKFKPRLFNTKEQNEFFALLQSFFNDTNTSIKSKAELIKVLSSQSFYLSLALKDAYDDKSKISSFHNFFENAFRSFKETEKIILNETEFCDILAQIIVYGFFISLVENDDFKIEKDSVDKFHTLLPKQFKILRKIVHFSLPDFELPRNIRIHIENILKTIALLDRASMSKFLNTELDKIVIYLYEDFLKAYDDLRATQKRKEGGVFTPLLLW